MAVPKRKTSPSRRGMRRAHDGISAAVFLIDPKTGESRLSHQASRLDGTYRGRKVKEGLYDRLLKRRQKAAAEQGEEHNHEHGHDDAHSHDHDHHGHDHSHHDHGHKH